MRFAPALASSLPISTDGFGVVTTRPAGITDSIQSATRFDSAVAKIISPCAGT